MTTDLRYILRRTLSNRITTLINMLGLTIGIVVAIVLVNYYVQESTYDHYHTKADRIYQAISRVAFNQGKPTTMSISFGNLAASLQDNLPQVENTARLYGPDWVEVDLPGVRYNDIQLLRLDYSFFDLFDYPGLTPGAFKMPNDAMVTQQLADRLFDGHAIGKSITVENEEYLIRSVIEIPKQTAYQFDIALPLESMAFFDELEDGGLEFETYALLRDCTNPTAAAQDLGAHYDSFMTSVWPRYEASNFFLPLKELYLNTAGVRTRMGNGNRDQLSIILTIAWVVLVLALINYMNLQIASNHTRAVETRLKKILGASKGHLLQQGILESLLVISLSAILAIAILDQFYQSDLSSLFGSRPLGIRDWEAPHFAIFVGIVLLVGTIAGAVPSLKLFNRHGMTQQSLRDKRLGKFTVGLVVFQFFITASLLVSIMFVNLQMDFIRQQPKGYDAEQVLVVDNLGDIHNENYALIKSQLEQQTTVLSVGAAQSAPGSGASGQFVHRRDRSKDEGIDVAHIRTLDGYVETLGLQFVAGGDFTITKPGGGHQFILNQQAASRLFPQGEEVVGAVIDMNGRVGPVVGIVEDFHYLSLKQRISPLALNVEDPYKATLMVKVSANNVQQSLAEIATVLSAFDPLYVFDYQFLDDQFARMYEAEVRMGKVITYATVVAFSISILGLLSLSLFVINSKLKEIAIRKALGGGQWHIFSRLSQQLFWWIVLGNLLALPLVYWLAQRWVRDFIYQISLGHLAWMSLASASLTLFAGFLVILRKLQETMRMNPVDFLRSE